MSRRQPALLSLLGLALVAGLSIAILPSASADPVPAPAGGAPTSASLVPGAAERGTGHDAHVRSAPLALKDRGPLPSSDEELRRNYDDPAATPPRERPSMKGSTAAAACATSDFTSRTGAALVSQIKASPTSCINGLFTLTGSDAQAAFREAQMTSVAYALRDNAAGYPGNNSTNTTQLVMYLRAGYYVQYYDPATVGTYGPTLQTAIRAGLDGFFANSRAFTVSDANGETLGEAITLIDSARENARYLHVVKRMLTSYQTSYNSSWFMVNAVNNSYTVLFRGHFVPAFVTAVQADPSVVDTLYNFASGHLSLLGTAQGFLAANSGRELGRFLQYPALQTKVRGQVKNLLAVSSIRGATAALWVGVAEMVDYYDKANCASYGICDFKDQLTNEILSIRHVCDPGHTIRAQAMTAAQLADTCTSVRNQDAFFHSTTPNSGPVANDRNTNIEINVFDSSADYKTYAGAIFGIDTNNGGMYLEGNPATVGNQARFIAYEAEWLRPVFAIWNLNHEYTHYLDGRFNLYGDFNASQGTPTVWWGEGIAEYVSYHYRRETYTAAITEAGKRTYSLRTLFDTTYQNTNTVRTYNWGYLAVRYMLQFHNSDVTTLLNYYRAGNWTAARSFLTSTIGTRYDADWYAWLSRCAAGNCGGTTIPTTTPTPTRTPTPTPTATSTPTATGTPGTECPGTETWILGRNCQRSNRSATAGGYHYFFISLPAGVSQLRITSSGGTGNCDLYYNPTTWATTSGYTSRSSNAGNAETLTVTNPAAGYRFISLYGVTGCTGVAVKAEY